MDPMNDVDGGAPAKKAKKDVYDDSDDHNDSGSESESHSEDEIEVKLVDVDDDGDDDNEPHGDNNKASFVLSDRRRNILDMDDPEDVTRKAEQIRGAVLALVSTAMAADNVGNNNNKRFNAKMIEEESLKIASDFVELIEPLSSASAQLRAVAHPTAWWWRESDALDTWPVRCIPCVKVNKVHSAQQQDGQQQAGGDGDAAVAGLKDLKKDILAPRWQVEEIGRWMDALRDGNRSSYQSSQRKIASLNERTTRGNAILDVDAHIAVFKPMNNMPIDGDDQAAEEQHQDPMRTFFFGGAKAKANAPEAEEEEEDGDSVEESVEEGEEAQEEAQEEAEEDKEEEDAVVVDGRPPAFRVLRMTGGSYLPGSWPVEIMTNGEEVNPYSLSDDADDEDVQNKNMTAIVMSNESWTKVCGVSRLANNDVAVRRVPEVRPFDVASYIDHVKSLKAGDDVDVFIDAPVWRVDDGLPIGRGARGDDGAMDCPLRAKVVTKKDEPIDSRRLFLEVTDPEAVICSALGSGSAQLTEIVVDDVLKTWKTGVFVYGSSWERPKFSKISLLLPAVRQDSNPISYMMAFDATTADVWWPTEITTLGAASRSKIFTKKIKAGRCSLSTADVAFTAGLQGFSVSRNATGGISSRAAITTKAQESEVLRAVIEAEVERVIGTYKKEKKDQDVVAAADEDDSIVIEGGAKAAKKAKKAKKIQVTVNLKSIDDPVQDDERDAREEAKEAASKLLRVDDGAGGYLPVSTWLRGMSVVQDDLAIFDVMREEDGSFASQFKASLSGLKEEIHAEAVDAEKDSASAVKSMTSSQSEKDQKLIKTRKAARTLRRVLNESFLVEFDKDKKAMSGGADDAHDAADDDVTAGMNQGYLTSVLFPESSESFKAVDVLRGIFALSGKELDKAEEDLLKQIDALDALVVGDAELGWSDARMRASDARVEALRGAADAIDRALASMDSGASSEGSLKRNMTALLEWSAERARSRPQARFTKVGARTGEYDLDEADAEAASERRRIAGDTGAEEDTNTLDLVLGYEDAGHYNPIYQKKQYNNNNKKGDDAFSLTDGGPSGAEVLAALFDFLTRSSEDAFLPLDVQAQILARLAYYTSKDDSKDADQLRARIAQIKRRRAELQARYDQQQQQQQQQRNYQQDGGGKNNGNGGKAGYAEFEARIIDALRAEMIQDRVLRTTQVVSALLVQAIQRDSDLLGMVKNNNISNSGSGTSGTIDVRILVANAASNVMDALAPLPSVAQNAAPAVKAKIRERAKARTASELGRSLNAVLKDVVKDFGGHQNLQNQNQNQQKKAIGDAAAGAHDNRWAKIAFAPVTGDGSSSGSQSSSSSPLSSGKSTVRVFLRLLSTYIRSQSALVLGYNKKPLRFVTNACCMYKTVAEDDSSHARGAWTSILANAPPSLKVAYTRVLQQHHSDSGEASITPARPVGRKLVGDGQLDKVSASASATDGWHDAEGQIVLKDIQIIALSSDEEEKDNDNNNTVKILSEALQRIANALDMNEKAINMAANANLISDETIEKVFDWKAELASVERSVRPDSIVGWTDLRDVFQSSRVEHELSMTALTVSAAFLNLDCSVILRKLLNNVGMGADAGAEDVNKEQQQKNLDEKKTDEIIAKARLELLGGTSSMAEDVRSTVQALSQECIEAGSALSRLAIAWEMEAASRDIAGMSSSMSSSLPISIQKRGSVASSSSKKNKYDADMLARKLSALSGLGVIRRFVDSANPDKNIKDDSSSSPLSAALQSVAGILIGKWASRLAMMRTDQSEKEKDKLKVLREEDKMRKMAIAQRLDEQGREMLKELRKVRAGPVDWAQVERDFVQPREQLQREQHQGDQLPQKKSKALVEDAIDAYWTG